MGRDFSACATVTIHWDDIHRDSIALAALLAGHGPFRGIVAVTRGGLVPAAIIAREMDIRLIDTVCVVGYDDRVQRDGPPDLLKSIEGDGTGWLVIDDLVDSGATYALLRDALPKAHFATVYAKPRGSPFVDTTAVPMEQDVWLIFPWDIELGGQTT